MWGAQSETEGQGESKVGSDGVKTGGESKLGGGGQGGTCGRSEGGGLL